MGVVDVELTAHLGPVFIFLQQDDTTEGFKRVLDDVHRVTVSEIKCSNSDTVD